MESSTSNRQTGLEGTANRSQAPHEPGHVHGVKVLKTERISPVQVRLSLEIEGHVVSEHEQHVARKYTQQARLPGFRPGKAPLKMILQKYLGEIRNEVVTHLVESATLEAIQETNLTPITRPKIDIKEVSFEGKPLAFAVEFEVQPEIELRHYKKIPLQTEKIDVNEEEVTKTFDNLRDRMSVLQPVENGKPEKGLFAVVEIGFEMGTTPPRSEAPKPYTIELGAGSLLPELDAAFLEMALGERRQVEATFPADYSDKDLAGQHAKYDCKLVELKKKVLPALDDAFAGQLKEGATVQSITEEIRENIKSGKLEDSKREQRRQILDYLIEKNKFEVPPSLIQMQMARLAEWMQEDFKRRGVPFGKLEQKDIESLQQRAEHMVRGSLLLKEVAEKEQIKIDEQKVSERVAEMAKQMNRSEEEATKFLSGKGMLDRLRDDILTDQVYDLLVQNAEVKETAVKS